MSRTAVVIDWGSMPFAALCASWTSRLRSVIESAARIESVIVSA
jgi:hypothetical protein